MGHELDAATEFLPAVEIATIGLREIYVRGNVLQLPADQTIAADDFMVSHEQPLRQTAPEESGDAFNEDTHRDLSA